jgi:hypothetical protein
MSMQGMLEAIDADDHQRAGKLLIRDRTLATLRISEARLYETKIVHWIYAGDTALHLAAAGHRIEIARLLLATGADPNAIMNHRQSGPLHYAADGCPDKQAWNERNQVETIRRLLEAGARINAQDKNGATPLHRAVRTRCAAAVQLLLEKGCDPSLRNKSGSTSFHLAVQNTGRGGSGSEAAKIAQRKIIESFLAHRVSVRLKDGKGKSVLDCAVGDWIREMFDGN